MSDKVLTIEDNKTYGFNLGDNIKKFIKVNEKFEKTRFECAKIITNYREEQDRKVVRLCLMKPLN